LSEGLEAARANLEAGTAGTAEYVNLEKAFNEAKKKFDRAEGELQQLSEDASRAGE
jgi:hypothetical protein